MCTLYSPSLFAEFIVHMFTSVLALYLGKYHTDSTLIYFADFTLMNPAHSIVINHTCIYIVHTSVDEQ